jgi:hypothetical protein
MRKEDLDIIVKMKFGSHLYGTSTEESDIDIKGVFMPSQEQVLLGRIPKSATFNTKTKGSDEKNTAEDVDEEYYSLHYFIDLACQGQTVALDMLHAHNDVISHRDELWKDLVENRAMFYSLNTKAFVGYARKQAARYGIKGSRLSDAKRVVEFLESMVVDQGIHPPTKLHECWHNLPDGEHIWKTPANYVGGKSLPAMYEVCGRKVQETVTVEYALDVFKKFVDQYGERAKLAETNEGVDWKAMSHALRAAYQLYEMLDRSTITMPRPEAKFLLAVKQGHHPYKQVAGLLESMMDRIEDATTRSGLPEKVDRSFWDRWLMKWMVNETWNWR